MERQAAAEAQARTPAGIPGGTTRSVLTLMNTKPGIRTLDDLRVRCKIDPATGCWLWQGSIDSEGLPRVWLPGQGAVSMTRALHAVLGLPAPTPKAQMLTTCGRNDCANPGHREMGSKSRYLEGSRYRRKPQAQAVFARTSSVFDLGAGVHLPEKGSDDD